jgi:hypothetical protein
MFDANNWMTLWQAVQHFANEAWPILAGVVACSLAWTFGLFE